MDASGRIPSHDDQSPWLKPGAVTKECTGCFECRARCRMLGWGMLKMLVKRTYRNLSSLLYTKVQKDQYRFEPSFKVKLDPMNCDICVY